MPLICQILLAVHFVYFVSESSDLLTTAITNTAKTLLAPQKSTQSSTQSVPKPPAAEKLTA